MDLELYGTLRIFTFLGFDRLV